MDELETDLTAIDPMAAPAEQGDALEFDTLEMGQEPPIEERLRCGSSLHAKILTRLNARRMMSERNIQNRYDDWNRVDEHCRLHIDLGRYAKRGDGSTSSTKKEMPWERSIVVPMSYAILQVYQTQMMAIFSRRDPMIEVSGTGPEDENPARIMSSVLGYDQLQSNFPFELYAVTQDANRYGVGAFYDCWMEKYGWKFMRRQPSLYDALLDRAGVPKVTKRWDKIKSFNSVIALDPYSIWPDPRVPLSRPQSGEFHGHRDWVGYLQLLEESQENGGPYFNLEHVLKTAPEQRAGVRPSNRFRLGQFQMLTSADEKDQGFHARDHMQIKLIPRDWDLGPETTPVKWWFSWVDQSVIIRAHECAYDHDEFTYAYAESNPDPHTTFNQGSIENLDGLQRFANWQFNSHIQNSMRHLNNSMIYAPALIEEADILNPNAAGHFRLTQLGERLLMEGRITADQMCHQLAKSDVTIGMLNDVNIMFDMAMRMTGASDALQGQITKDKRTLGEIQQVNQGASLRMALQTGLMDANCIRPLALRMIANRQQNTDQAQYYRIAGNQALEMGVGQDGRWQLVRPEDLAGNFDYEPRTGPQPPDPTEMAETWVKIGQMVAAGANYLLQVPDREGRTPDPHEILKEAIRSTGVKSTVQYYKQYGPPKITVLPDQQVEEQRRQGNLVPMQRGQMTRRTAA